MKYKLNARGIREFGLRRDAQGNPHQEDCLYPPVEELCDNTPGRLYLVCDGMGGHDAGEVASKAVCDGFASALKNVEPEGGFSDEMFLKALGEAYLLLDTKDTGADKKPGTTMTFLKFHSGGATVAHIGDSRVYHIRPGADGNDTEILFQTSDHSLYNEMMKIGELSPEQIKASVKKNIITRAMQPGIGSRCKADIAHIDDIRAGDYFYLCSDGMLEDEEMDSGQALKNIFSRHIPSIDDKVKILRGATGANRDNHSAILVEVLETQSADGSQRQQNALKSCGTQPVSNNSQATCRHAAQKPNYLWLAIAGLGMVVAAAACLLIF